MTTQCFECGFQTQNPHAFVATQGDGRNYWEARICPQCSAGNPRVAPVGSTEFPEPVWGLMESNEGILVWSRRNGCRSSAPMIREHQLANQPASMLRAGESGTILDLSARLAARGRARSAAFRAAAEAARAAFPAFRMTPEQITAYTARLDALREEHRVGPHDTRIEHRVSV